MRRVLAGQILLIICFGFYLVWWYRGFRPGTSVNRVRGLNGVLLGLTALFGVSGIALTVLGGSAIEGVPKINPALIPAIGIAAYVALLLITRGLFQRVVTSELLLIVGWTVLEAWTIVVLNGAAYLSDGQFAALMAVLAAAFIVSNILYVAYYRMEEMKAFYAAMVPLVAAEVFMLPLVRMMVL